MFGTKSPVDSTVFVGVNWTACCVPPVILGTGDSVCPFSPLLLDVTSSFFFLVVMPGALVAPLLLVVRPGAPGSFLFLIGHIVYLKAFNLETVHLDMFFVSESVIV